ncbi:hypothetical protein ACTS35_19695 [Citrobacter freundii]|uniref:hypothetical protein n=1 Tax=Citrobacter freundii TaxID=546 RepID=UPI0023B320EB|nr:hypothetical protein [Citrobacter freundii]MDE9592541.1 hypothetical protein [Citrobacter freundii]MDV1709636.1 hypothetical protein [Citrobacter freundii]MDV2012016.1 hypothetical protein [Citrobacter freundii]MEB0313369.1 hypothetical protein [Citrobacter freundii]MEB0379852.1 hypothetical protein [Citrobacter freundii]
MSELWQPCENLFLHDVCKTMPLHIIAEKLERTERAIITQASRIGAPLPSRMTGRPWTPAELHLFGRFSVEEIATATGRSIYSVRSKRDALTRSGGLTMREWSTEELAILMRYTNAEVVEITGRSIEEVGDKRLAVNIERNGWDVRNPEREDS